MVSHMREPTVVQTRLEHVSTSTCACTRRRWRSGVMPSCLHCGSCGQAGELTPLYSSSTSMRSLSTTAGPPAATSRASGCSASVKPNMPCVESKARGRHTAAFSAPTSTSQRRPLFVLARLTENSPFSVCSLTPFFSFLFFFYSLWFKWSSVTKQQRLPCSPDKCQYVLSKHSVFTRPLFFFFYYCGKILSWKCKISCRWRIRQPAIIYLFIYLSSWRRLASNLRDLFSCE